MITFFPTTYRDNLGKEAAVIQNDGKNLSMTIRGVKFAGSMFDNFEPQNADVEEAGLNSFSLHNGYLCSCEIDCEIPIHIIVSGNIIESKLYAHIELGKPKPNDGIKYERIRLELLLYGKIYKSLGMSGWFDDELREIQNLLPNDVYLKSCYTCTFSAYHPAGYGTFGCLACFRNNKKEYLKIQNKIELINFFSQKTETVQETWLCPEYKNVSDSIK